MSEDWMVVTLNEMTRSNHTPECGKGGEEGTVFFMANKPPSARSTKSTAWNTFRVQAPSRSNCLLRRRTKRDLNLLSISIS